MLLRRDQIGFIFQLFALLPIPSAWENVELPLRIAGVRSGRERRARAEAGAGAGRAEEGQECPPPGRDERRPAAARRDACALPSRPRLLLADEPTGEPDFDHRPRHPPAAARYCPGRGRDPGHSAPMTGRSTNSPT